MFSNPVLDPTCKRLVIEVSCVLIDHYRSIEPLVGHLLTRCHPEQSVSSFS